MLPPMNPRVMLPVFLAALVGAGCSAFDRDWKKAADLPQTGIEGRWVGQWKSNHNQHAGLLRCMINRKEGQIFHTRFHAKYKLGIITVGFPYEMDMTVEQVGDNHQFSGKADLGKLAGGVYNYQGSGTTNQITIRFRSPKDHGTFHLQRPKETD